MSLFEIIGKTLFYMFHRLLLPIFPCIFLFSKGAAMSANDILYALKYSNDIKLVPSAELVDKFPEALVSFLESHTQFNWSESPSADNIETSNTWAHSFQRAQTRAAKDSNIFCHALAMNFFASCQAVQWSNMPPTSLCASLNPSWISTIAIRWLQLVRSVSPLFLKKSKIL